MSELGDVCIFLWLLFVSENTEVRTPLVGMQWESEPQYFKLCLWVSPASVAWRLVNWVPPPSLATLHWFLGCSKIPGLAGF